MTERSKNKVIYAAASKAAVMYWWREQTMGVHIILWTLLMLICLVVADRVRAPGQPGLEHGREAGLDLEAMMDALALADPVDAAAAGW